MHFHQWCQAGGVAKVVTVLAFGEGRAGGRFNTANRRIHPARHLFPQEWEGETTEVRTTTGTTHQHVRDCIDLRQLQQCFFTYNRLVQQYVIQDAAERIARLRVFYRLTDSL